MSLGFTKSVADPNLPIRLLVIVQMLILVMYIDDLFLTGEEQLLVGCERELASVTEMEDLGLLDWDWWCS